MRFKDPAVFEHKELDEDGQKGIATGPKSDRINEAGYDKGVYIQTRMTFDHRLKATAPAEILTPAVADIMDKGTRPKVDLLYDLLTNLTIAEAVAQVCKERPDFLHFEATTSLPASTRVSRPSSFWRGRCRFFVGTGVAAQMSPHLDKISALAS
jgi:hypothetical protein